MIHDVIVVGSGPGGAVAATTLTQQGKSVLLVDRQTFPRDKVCGDGLPIHVMLMLREMGIDIERDGLEYQRVTGLTIEAPSGKALSTEEITDDAFSMTSPRLSFDNVLHQHAIKSGAQFEVMNVIKPLIDDKSKRVIGVIERRGKEQIEHEAKMVIAADGATSALARAMHGRTADPQAIAVSIRAYAYLKKPMPSCVYFYFTRDLLPGYAWIFPTAGNRCNIGVYLHNQDYKSRGADLEALLDEFSARMQREFPHEIDTPTRQTWSLPLYADRHSRSAPGLLFVGDAGGFVNALTGGGIYPAMMTGQAAGKIAAKILAGETSEAEYDVAWQRDVSGSLGRARLMQKHILSSAKIFNSVFALANLPILRGPMLRVMSGEHY
ncbi:MAG: geranylgeranyl reductase family protein [Anaerolineae bacterium]|nr:geranylgeranyl reductase family protein [Anaerolineae bacterium]